jgi:1-acyl-sn-glycerol-3-phosphate acyltransferase
VVVSRLWTTGILKAAQFFLGIRTCVRGKQHLSDVPLPYIIACQHQSAWETLFFNTLVPNPVFFLKRSLLFLPIVGIYLRGLGMIPISRAQKKEMKKSRHEMDQAIQKAIAQKRPFILFPEGTRMRPGEQKPYHSGVYHIAKDYGLPVIPAALNSGIYWPRRGFLKKPGTICLTFGPPLDASLPKAEFIAQLRDRIEQQGGDPMPDEKCA